MMLNWIKFRGGHARARTLSLRSSNPPSHIGDSRKYVSTKACIRMHIRMYKHICTCAHKHLRRSVTKRQGRRDERQRQMMEKRNIREESRSVQRAFYGIYATWAGILKSLIARWFNSRIRIPWQQNGIFCTHGSIGPFSFSRRSDSARSSRHSHRNWFCGYTV